MSYGVVPAHEGDKKQWKVTFAGKEIIKTDVQEFAEDFAYMMTVCRSERAKQVRFS